MNNILLITKDIILFNKLSFKATKDVNLTYTESLDNAKELCKSRNITQLIVDSDTIPFKSLSFFEMCRSDLPNISVKLLHNVDLPQDLVEKLHNLDVTLLRKPITLQKIISTNDFPEEILEPEVIEEPIKKESPKQSREEELLLNIMGTSPKMEKIARIVMKVAPTAATVFLSGENGTGKEYFAKIIHKLSKREGDFVPVNCGAIVETLFESELFGHKKGSFTGADQDRVGLVEQAENGTLFLDEVGELSLASQVKLLRFLQERTYKPVGENIEKKSNTRVIAATNRDLKKMVEEGTFREDLFYRIHIFPIVLPPLRERKETIPQLVELFLFKQKEKLSKNFTNFSKDAEIALIRHNYPGNIRELENIIEYATILATPPTVTLEDLPEHLQLRKGIEDHSNEVISIGYNGDEKVNENNSGVFFVDSIITIEELEEKYMRFVLKEFNGNHSEAAKALGVSRSTLWRKLKED